MLENISKDTLINLIAQSPVAVGLLMGRDLVVEFANEQILQLWRKNASIIGMPLIAALPELKGQPFIDILTNVFDTGETYIGERVKVALLKDGEEVYPYFNFTYSAIRNNEEEIIGVSVTATEVTEQVETEAKVEESESLYKNLIHEAEVPTVLYKGRDLIVEVINDKAREIWGKDYEVAGLKLEDALPELKNQPFLDILRNVFDTGNMYKEEAAKVDFDYNGTIQSFYINLFYKPIRNKKGEIYAILNMGIDVTSQINQQRQLLNSAKRLEDVINSVPLAMSVLRGPEFIIEMTNQSTSKLWEKHEDRIGKKILDVYPELENHKIMEHLRQAYFTGKEVKVKEMPIVIKNSGKTRYINYIIRPLDSSGDEKTIISVGFDVTDELEMKEQLRVSESNFKDLANSVPQIVWTATPDGKLDYFNNRWYEYSGFDKESTEDWYWEKIIHPEDKERVNKAWKHSLQSGSSYEIEYRFINTYQPEKSKWFLARALPVKNKDGETIKWIGSSTDIDDFKQLQNQKDTFLGIASHELKTPLTSLTLYASFIEKSLKEKGDNRNGEVAVKINEQISKLNNLITDLLDATKIQNGKMVMSEDVFDFDKLAASVVEEQQLTAKQKILLDTDCKVGEVKADKNRIAQVMSNFISNAVKYSPKADKILIDVNCENNRVKFSVQDFGIGIPENKLKKIFHQYYRVNENNAGNYPGLGLGLYISSEIISRSGGTISVESTEGKGSVFSFEIPKNIP